MTPSLVVGIVLDESGSMYSRTGQTIEGYNKYLGDLKKDNADKTVLFSLTKFNTHFSLVHTAEPLSDISELSNDNYRPSGMTALYDAVAKTVLDMEKRVEPGIAVLVVIMTDGHENSSSEYRGEDGLKQVRELLTRKTKEDNWSFVFLGADADAWNVGMSLGATQAYAFNVNDVGGTMRSISAGTQAYTQSVTSGEDDSVELTKAFDKAYKEKTARNIDMDHCPGIDDTEK